MSFVLCQQSTVRLRSPTTVNGQQS